LLSSAARACAVVLLPGVVAIVVVRHAVPPRGAAPGLFAGVVAEAGARAPLLLGMGVFFAVSAMVRYWWTRLAPRPPRARSVAQSRGAAFLSTVGLVAVAAVAAVAVRTFGARPYRVEGASMLPTLEPGDLVAGRIAASSAAPRRGDVVVLAPRKLGLRIAGEGLVKRVIGLPGDRIGMRGSAPIINGWTVPSCDAGEYLYVLGDGGEAAIHGRLRVEFLDDRAYLVVAGPASPFAETIVPAGDVFVLGDDRSMSVDSRAFGGAPPEAMVAQVDRFLVGTHRDGHADFDRFLHPLDSLAAHVRLEGLDELALASGVARCLAQRPGDTHPPPRPL